MWFHNMSNGMDQDSLNKWKEEFQNERQEQFSKVKQLQKETLKRRKQMEIKRKIDAAKEEKRRREALAERRAQHVEATMRFQKGIKNYRANKEKISLEEALKSLNRRNTSADQTLNSTSSDAYNSLLNKPRPQTSTIIRNHMRRSSSFNDVNFIMGNNNNNNDRLNFIDFKQQYNFDINNVISKPIDDTYKTIKSDNNNYNTTNNAQTLLTENLINTTNRPSTTTTTTTTNNNNNNFKVILDENQKTIQNFNKDALIDFKKTIMNEIKSTTTTITDKNKQDTTIKILQSTTNDTLNNKKDIITSSTDDLTVNNDVVINDELSSISSNNNLSDIEDSLEVEPINNKIKSTSTKAVETNTFINKPVDEKNSFNNQIANIKNHFLTKTLTTEFFTNSLLSNKRTYYSPQFNNYDSNNNNNSNTIVTNDIKNNNNNNNNNNLVSNVNNNNNNIKESNIMPPQIIERPIQRSNTVIKIQQSNIKSILKRSTSDNNINLLKNNQYLNFGIKAEKIEVKDSFEITTNRIKSNNTPTKETLIKKKSVRFAQHDSNNNENEIQDDSSDTIDHANTNSNSKPPQSNTRSTVKSRLSLNYKKPVSSIPVTNLNDESHTSHTSDDSKIIDGRPPLPISYLHENNSYLVMSQKRKDFQEKFRNKGYSEFLTSPKSSPHIEQNKTSTLLTTTSTINTNKPTSQIKTEIEQITNHHHHQQQQQQTSMNKFNEQNEKKVQSNNNFNLTEKQNLNVDKNEIKKSDNILLTTYNNKYGNSEPSVLNQNKHLLARFNNQLAQQNQNDILDDQTQNYIYNQTILNGNFKKVPTKPIVVKAFANTTSVVEIQQLPYNNGQNRRPYSANTPLITSDNLITQNPVTQNNNNNNNNLVYQNQSQQVPRINTKLMTFNLNSPTSPQRILSADQNPRYRKYINGPMIQLKIQYPENFKFVQNAPGNEENVTLSMKEFLKAEEMCNSHLSESKVINILDNKQINSTTTATTNKIPAPVSLSVEEQNVKNSIQRLNDRLNLINRKTQTGLRRNYN